MSSALSPDTQAILLLTAPLLAGRTPSTPDDAPDDRTPKPLAPGEYRDLAARLRAGNRGPADLLEAGAAGVARECGAALDPGRLEALLARGFLLSQSVESWRARAIWVRSAGDPGYPERLRQRLGPAAPPVLYGCGEAAIPEGGGLAVVGSRRVSEPLVAYARRTGALAAAAGRPLISGGARGVDRAAVFGALDAGGSAVEVLADGLERAATQRQHREALLAGRLALLSSSDPAAPFHIGLAMQRNKWIYALADAALVVNAEPGRGGTWAGAVEQLERSKFAPVYVRPGGGGEAGVAAEALRQRGARLWPDPGTPEELRELLDSAPKADADAPRPGSLWGEPPGTTGD